MRIALELHIDSELSEKEHAHLRMMAEKDRADREESRIATVLNALKHPIRAFAESLFGSGCPTCAAKRADETDDEPEVH